MTLKQLMKLSKKKLLLKLKKEFAKKIDALPKRKIAELCYNMAKSKLPQLKTIKQKSLPKKKTKKKSKQKGKKKVSAKQQKAYDAGARRLKAWNKENR